MTKTKVTAGLLSVAILGGVALGLGANNASAASLDTPVRVQFEDGGQITDPDPANGTLQLKTVPALYDFGTHTAGNAVQHTASIPQSVRYVGLHDDRTTSASSGGEWKLTANASELVNVANGSATPIDSGVLNIGVGSWKDWTIGSSVTTATTNTSSTITDGAGISGTTLSLDLDGASKVVATTNNSSIQGYALPINSVELSLAAADTNSTMAGQTFSGNIIWTLEDTI